MNQEIDKTIEKIERDLTENEQPLPKAAPTQRGINCPPHEEHLYLFKADCCKCNFKIRQEYSQVPECQDAIDAAAEHTVECRHKIEYVFISRMTGRSVSDVFLPPKPAWAQLPEIYEYFSGVATRFYRSFWCLGVHFLCIGHSIYLILNASGSDRWWYSLLGVCWTYNTFNWLKNWRERKKDREKR